MKNTQNKKPVFIPYDQRVQPLIPPSWDDLIEANHPVRVINSIVESIDLASLTEQYCGGGRANYHPKMLIKLTVYCYLNNIFSSRRMEQYAKESIHCMWLTGMQAPDHNTINRFRGERLKEPLKDIFVEVVKLLQNCGLISLVDAFIDGTKIEANANKFSFVWGKSVRRYKMSIQNQIEEIWNYAQSIAKEELRGESVPDFQAITGEKLSETIQIIEKALKGRKDIEKKVRQKIAYIKKDRVHKLDKYIEQEKLLGNRNSFSKTDPEATFMRMKEDRLQSRELRAAYNVQISTNKQFVLLYSIHQNRTDSPTLPGHLAELIKRYGIKPLNVIADAGYGSEENYHFLETRGIKGYVKYNNFDYDRRKKKKQVQQVERFTYNAEEDTYTCLAGKNLRCIGEAKRVTETGYERKAKIYEAEDCGGCPLRDQCHTRNSKQKNRKFEVDHEHNRLRKQAEGLLKSEEGIAYRKQRSCEVEPVFGNIKHNKHFRKFTLRGIAKVAIEAGLLFLAHNIRKAISLNVFAPSPQLT